jgi:HD-like signal output (HDOD) protein
VLEKHKEVSNYICNNWELPVYIGTAIEAPMAASIAQARETMNGIS